MARRATRKIRNAKNTKHTRRAKNSPFTFSIEKTKGKSKHTFVFVHDIGFDKRFWFPIMTDIGNDVRAVAYDLAGFGENAAATLPPHTLSEHADQLFAVLDKAKIRNPILIGIRFGGHIILEAIKKDAERLKGAMIGGVLPYTATEPEYQQLSQLIATLNKSDNSEAYADHLISTLNVDTENSSQLRYQISNCNAHNIAATLTTSLTRTSALHALLDCPYPICILVGQDQHERIQRECINISFNKENMSVIRVPESTTLYNLENPKAFRNAIVRFITLFEKNT